MAKRTVVGPLSIQINIKVKTDRLVGGVVTDVSHRSSHANLFFNGVSQITLPFTFFVCRRA